MLAIVNYYRLDPFAAFSAVERLTGTVSGAAPDTSGHMLQLHYALIGFLEDPISGQGMSRVHDADAAYMGLLQGGGILALTSYLAVMGCVLALALKLRFKLSPPRSFAHVMATGLLASVCVMLLTSLVGNAVYDRYLYVSVGLMLALKYGMTNAPQDYVTADF